MQKLDMSCQINHHDLTCLRITLILSIVNFVQFYFNTFIIDIIILSLLFIMSSYQFLRVCFWFLALVKWLTFVYGFGGCGCDFQKMAKQIMQETFDAVVQENIEVFEMSEEEAVAEAIQQFEAQVWLVCLLEFICRLV